MKVIKEFDGLAFISRKGPIHRPTMYIVHKDCGWQWEWLPKTKSGHWTFAFGRLIFTTM